MAQNPKEDLSETEDGTKWKKPKNVYKSIKKHSKGL